MITIYFLVILPLPNKEDILPQENMIRLVPLKFISDFLRESSFKINNPSTYISALKEPCFYTVFFNILMTVPFGMYLRYYFKCNLKKTIKLSFYLSLFFEITQITGLYFIYPHPYRVFDVDDLLMNTLGGVLGYFLFGIIDDYLPTREEIDSHALEKGKTVSGIRRIMIFNLDSFLILVIYIFLSIFIRNKYLFIILFLIYYIIYPYFRNGTTLGSKFLNVRLEFKKYKLVNITLRILFIHIYYFGIFLIVYWINKILINLIQFDYLLILGINFILLLSTLLFYLINMIVIIKNKTIFYDTFFEVKYESTIKK